MVLDGSQIAFTIAVYARNREDIAVLSLDSDVVVRFVIPKASSWSPTGSPSPGLTAVAIGEFPSCPERESGREISVAGTNEASRSPTFYTVTPFRLPF
jgi:hypothetical protein